MDDGGMRTFGMDIEYGQVRVCAINYHKQQRTKNSARTKMVEA